MKKMQLMIKRLVDIILSLSGIILISPILILVSILIKIFMPGPIFFKQERVGKNEKLFNILKFRTMKVDLVAEQKYDFSKDSERLTKLGKILRRTKIDELPQLFNVLKGDMSLIGPRPTVKEQTDKYNDFQKRRLEIRPGMTGLAQVNGNILLEWKDRIKYDVDYIDNYSLYLDLKIILKTILVVIFGEDKFKK